MSVYRLDSHDFHPAAVLDAHPDGILVVDQAGVVRYANPAAAGAFDASLESIIGRQFSLPLDGGRTLEIRASGGRLLRMRCRPTLWGTQAARLVCLTDVTELRRNERHMQALSQRMEEREHPITDIEHLDLVCDALEALARAADGLHGRLHASPGLLVRQAADTLMEHAALLGPVFDDVDELMRLPALLDDVADELQSENTYSTETADHLRRALGRLRARVRQIQRRAARGTEAAHINREATASSVRQAD